MEIRALFGPPKLVRYGKRVTMHRAGSFAPVHYPSSALLKEGASSACKNGSVKKSHVRIKIGPFKQKERQKTLETCQGKAKRKSDVEDKALVLEPHRAHEGVGG